MGTAVVFYVSAMIAIGATFMMLTSVRPVHALLYLAVSLLAVAIIFFTLGAPFVAALEVIIYAGAIMVLFIFVVMMLNLGERAIREERTLLNGKMWIVPGVLSAVLFGEFAWLMTEGAPGMFSPPYVEPSAVGRSLYGPYLIGVELASMLLLAGLVGAYHLGWRKGARPQATEGR